MSAPTHRIAIRFPCRLRQPVRRVVKSLAEVNRWRCDQCGTGPMKRFLRAGGTAVEFTCQCEARTWSRDDYAAYCAASQPIITH